MRSMCPRALFQGLVIASLALPATGFVTLAATPAVAQDVAILGTEKTARTKRTNGRDANATSSVAEIGERKSGSMGRARNTEPAPEVVADADGPILLQFEREVTSSTRLRGTSGLSRSDLVIAEEIAGFDFTAATPDALEAPAPGSLSAQLAQYRTQRLALFRAAEHQMNAYENYLHMQGLDSAAIATLYPDGAFDGELLKARETFFTLREAVDRRQTETQTTLLEISGGTPLSVAAVRALHSLLGV